MAFLTKYILVNNLMPLLENYKVIDEIIQYKNTKFEHFLVLFLNSQVLYSYSFLLCKSGNTFSVIIDLFGNSTSRGNLYVNPYHSSSHTSMYASVQSEVSLSNSSLNPYF